MIQRTLEQAANMAGGKLKHGDKSTMFQGVEIDSRKVQPGNLFVPLIGARSDGHDYILQVKEKGAAAMLWQKDHPLPEVDFPLILVNNTEEALQNLAKSYLKQVDPIVIAITGSNGKTSVKDMMDSVLSMKYKTHKTPGNRNNQIGLPLTILEMDEDAEAAILEMGMENFHEIQLLTSIAPANVSIITNIGSAHKENLGSKDNIARAKLEILAGTKPRGLFLYNQESPEIEKVLDEIQYDSSIVLSPFGSNSPNRVEEMPDYKEKGIEFKASLLSSKVFIPAFGLIQAQNALPVIQTALSLGLEEEKILEGLANLRLTKMRTALVQLDKAKILDDSYKSNPESAKAAIDTLMDIPAEKHIAVLADMLDLGEDEKELHEMIGRYAKEKGADALYAFGPRSIDTALAFGNNGYYYEDKKDLLDDIQKYLNQDAVLLVKGSRAMSMDSIVEDLVQEDRKMNKLKLGVIFGGQSSEYSVSLHSAASFLREIKQDRYDITLIGIDPKGHFYIYNGSIDDIEHDTWKKEEYITPMAWKHKGIVALDGQDTFIELDCVFPILHGKNGEDGCMQGLLELMNIHYVGCDVLSSAMCMDKEIMHILLDEANIPAAPYICLKENEEIPSFESVAEKVELPWIIKPCNAGSSYGVSKVETKEEYQEALKEAFKYDGRGKALVEHVIDGFEIGCAVMGNDTPVTGSVDEIQINNGFFDFEGKYAMKGAEIFCPARIGEKEFKEAQSLAKKAYKAMNCLGLARVDMFITPENKIVVNELNTIPGFTATSRYPSMMKEAGLSFSDLIDQLIQLAMERKISQC